MLYLDDIMHKYDIYIPTMMLISASLFFIYDIAVDLHHGTDSHIHVFIECAVFIGTSIALYMEIRRVTQLRNTVFIEQGKVARLSGELFNEINKEFDKWDLTLTEKEIAMLLIKGLSMQEIGNLRGVKEKTIRQQATQIYVKSKCANRQEFASHFIEDLIRTIPE